MANLFFLIFGLTILLTRIILYFRPTPSPTIIGFRLHHYMFGIVMVAISLPFEWLYLYAVGLALFVDELTWLIMRGKNHTDNYSWKSLVGTALLTALVFLLRDYLILPFV